MTMSLREAIARHVLGLIRPEALPAVALDAMVEGADSPQLRLLAGETPQTDPRDLHDLFHRAVTELGLLPVPALAAARFLVTCVATSVAEGRLAPRAGAVEIVEDILRTMYDEIEDDRYVGDGLGVASLVGLYCAHDDVRPGSGAKHEGIDQAILEECRRLAAASDEDS